MKDANELDRSHPVGIREEQGPDVVRGGIGQMPMGHEESYQLHPLSDHRKTSPRLLGSKLVNSPIDSDKSYADLC